jgi:hypothetical protein
MESNWMQLQSSTIGVIVWRNSTPMSDHHAKAPVQLDGSNAHICSSCAREPEADSENTADWGTAIYRIYTWLRRNALNAESFLKSAKLA